MNNIKILDCTLRDGGYINDWCFGNEEIQSIIQKISESAIEIIECGFISEVEYNPERSLYSKMEYIEKLLPMTNNSDGTMYVGMIALGEKEIAYNKIGPCNENGITGIRLTFHKNEVDRVFEYATDLMGKGYQVFIQPVGIISYSDKEILKLIERVNLLNPFSFYIVDTLGTMNGEELLRLFYLIDHNLNGDIAIGFHSHNNLQLSFSNAQELINLYTNREIIIDASVFGMGRGAGNLCSELIVQFLNDNLEKKYDLTPLLEVMDEYILPIKKQKEWGYSAPYYLAAINKCHPNYATYLINKQTLSMQQIKMIIGNIPNEERCTFNKKYIEKAYLLFQENYVDDTECVKDLTEQIQGRKVLVIAPGKSISKEEDKVCEFIHNNDDVIRISVNFKPEVFKPNYVYVSNLKRVLHQHNTNSQYKQMSKMIVTSNIIRDKNFPKDMAEYVINYASYLNEHELVADNAGLMLLKLLIKCGVKDIYLAGFDGFKAQVEENYYNKRMINAVDSDILFEKNKVVAAVIKEMRERAEIHFITNSLYV